MRFGPYRLDPGDRLLYRSNELVPLPPKVMDTLLLLATSGGRVLGKDEMIRQLWPDTFVEEGTLTQYISLIRKALGTDAHWVENLPRRGYRFNAPVELCGPEAAQSNGPAPVPRTTRYRRLSAWAALPVVAAGACLWWYMTVPTPIRSVAVLPFSNLSGDSKFDYISDGLTDELTHALMKLNAVKVAARTSASQFRGRREDVRAIGKQLNVAGVLEGSVRVQGKQMRITAQLVDARSGYHVWSETYDSTLDDLLSIQERIGTATARKLAADTEAARPDPAARTPEAFRAYLQGRYFLARGRPETFSKAADSFRRAITADPKYAEAHSGLADTYYRWALWESDLPRVAFARAREAASKALALDGTLAEAHASLANIRFQHDWDLTAAERDFRRSLALNPHRADTWHWFSHLLTALGRFKESEQASRKAVDLEPLDLPSLNHVGWCYYFAGDYARAVEQHRRVLELDPAHGQTRLLLGRALVQQGVHGEAIAELRRNLDLSPDSAERMAALAQAYAAAGDHRNAYALLNSVLRIAATRYASAYSIAGVYASLGQRAQALAYLEKALVERSSRLVELKYEPVFKPLHNEPAYQAVVRRIGL
ncbi:MAG TPA: tetratricopeptide repeat protein [Bryobacteraceae bacterium]|nr:tetratricopeptide repeat protein [Bryobacteraceae bacterium]